MNRSEVAVSRLAPELPPGTPWSYRTKRFRLLAHDFAIRSTHEGIGRYLDELFAPSAIEGEPETWYSILSGLPGRQSDALHIGDGRAVHTDRTQFVLTYLLWHINQQVIAKSCANYVLVHAAAAARGGVGVVMPAASEAGKTTLVAGLVSAGFGYLSDEAAAIDPETGLIVPFAKPLSIDQGSWAVLAQMEPRLDDATRAYVAQQWQVSPQAIRPGSVSGRVRPHLVVLPTYRQEAETRLEPVSRVDTLLAMLRHTFHFEQAGRRNFDVLARLVASVDCYRLTVGNLNEACEALEGVVEARSP